MCVTDQSRTKNEENECCGGFCLILGFICLIVLVVICATYVPLLDTYSGLCMVTKVTYPTHLPTNENYLNENFVSCDCGRRCISDAGYCIKVFVEYQNETFLAQSIVSYNSDNACTISEENCIDGESLSDRLQALETAAELAEPYMQMVNTTQEIDCFIHNGNIFLQSQDKDSIIIGASISGVLAIVFVILSIHNCRK
jgi:hypothetical protein